MNKHRWFSVLVASLLLAGTFTFTGSKLDAQGNTRTFPETGHTVKGLFLTYWDNHGALAQQGYPISEEMQEQSDTDGKTYTVQYFQRAVFELHPEFAGTPSEVLLSLLGVFYYNDKYAGNAAGQKINPKNPRRFSETGKTVGGAFRQYWEQHGGLAQQGYPISDEFSEVSATDGKTYTVQYFQRAVFEFHPELAAPNNVLLSLLGVFYYNKKHGSIGTPLPTAPTPTTTPSPPSLDNSGQVIFYNDQLGRAVVGHVDASGNYTDLKVAVASGSTGWTDIVALGGGRLLFYNRNNGRDGVGKVATDGTYTDTAGSYALTLGSGWTHLASAGNNLIVYYKTGTGTGGTARVNLDGSITLLRVYTTFSTGWTNITGLDNGVVVFYERSTGLISANGVDNDGNLVNQKIYNKVTLSDRVVASIDGRVLFYRYQNGEAVAARFDQTNTFIGLMSYPAEAPPLPNPYPIVAGMSNGTLLFYNDSSREAVTGRLSGDGSVTIYNHIPAGTFQYWSHIVGIR
jgi:hypothetical protein